MDPNGHGIKDWLKSAANSVRETAVGAAKEVANTAIDAVNLITTMSHIDPGLKQALHVEPYKASNTAQDVGMKGAFLASLISPRGGLKVGAKALEQLAIKQLEKRFVVTLGREITATEKMADIVAIAKSGKSAVVQEVTTATSTGSKSISGIRKQLENGFDYAVKQGIAGDKIKVMVRLTDQRLAGELGKNLGKIRGRDVKIILE